MNSATFSSKVLKAGQIIEIFNDLFLDTHGTCLKGGAPEPLYEPGLAGGVACIYFRDDFAASALHEIAHWCIAGAARRTQLDYGYWYNPDGRNSDAQRAFLKAEARPQALEWHFAQAAGVPFGLSMDNLDAPVDGDATAAFARAVVSEAHLLTNKGLPPRGRQIFEALAGHSGWGRTPAALNFSEAELR